MKEYIITIKTCEMCEDDLDCLLNAIKRDQGALIERMEADY